MFTRTQIGGTLILPAVLIGVAPPSIADTGITTQNVRRGIAPAHVRHDVRQAAAAGSVLLTQEMGWRHPRRFRPPGWSVAHVGAGRRGDCATFYDRDVWRLRRSYVVPLPARRWALVAVLTGRHPLAAVCVHMPTHNVSRGVYWSGIDRLRPLLRRLSSRFRHVAVGGDWNNVYRTRARFRGFTSARPPAGTGPKGGRVDYVYVRRPAHIARVRIIRHTYSDHNGVRVWVRNR